MRRSNDTAAVVAIRLLVAGLALVVVVGCSSGEDSSSEGDTSSTDVPSTSSSVSQTASETPQPTKADVVEVRIVVRNGKVRPPLHRAKIAKGKTVRLTVTADVRDEVHVHGYDVSKSVRPGRPAILEFVADEQGLFEVELEQAGLPLVQLQVQ